MRAGELVLFSGQQHSRNKYICVYIHIHIYIYSYSPNREEQRNLTGNSFKLIPSITVPFLHLSLQTKQLCTLKTREITNSQARAGTFSVLLFVLL